MAAGSNLSIQHPQCQSNSPLHSRATCCCRVPRRDALFQLDLLSFLFSVFDSVFKLEICPSFCFFLSPIILISPLGSHFDVKSGVHGSSSGGYWLRKIAQIVFKGEARTAYSWRRPPMRALQAAANSKHRPHAGGGGSHYARGNTIDNRQYYPSHVRSLSHRSQVLTTSASGVDSPMHAPAARPVCTASATHQLRDGPFAPGWARTKPPVHSVVYTAPATHRPRRGWQHAAAYTRVRLADSFTVRREP